MRLRQELQALAKKLDSISERLEEVATPPRLLTLARAARCLGVGETKLQQLIRTRVVRTVKLGARRMVPLSEVVRVATISEPRRGPDIEPKTTGRVGADEARARLARL